MIIAQDRYHSVDGGDRSRRRRCGRQHADALLEPFVQAAGRYLYAPDPRRSRSDVYPIGEIAHDEDERLAV